MSDSVKTIVVNQPTYLPWLGFFDQIDQADTFIFYDDVQFVKQYWYSRNRIPSNDSFCYLNVIIKQAPLGSKINEIYLADNRHNFKKTFKTIYYSYLNAPYFKEVYPFLEQLYQDHPQILADFNIHIITAIAKAMNLNTELKKSSEIELKATDRVDKLIELAEMHHAQIYLSPRGAADYLQNDNAETRFAARQVQLLFHHYEPFPYKENFIPYMSIIDCLFYHGFEGTLEIIRKGRKQSLTAQQVYAA